MKKDNQQKIIEAAANLQVAKLLQAIENLKTGTLEFGKLYDSDIADTRKTISAVLTMVEAAQAFKKHCSNMQDIKMVTDVIDGIKLRANYEYKIRTLNERLSKGQKLFKEAVDRYKELVRKISNFIETDDKDFIGTIRPLSEYIDKCVDELMPQECKTDEVPF